MNKRINNTPERRKRKRIALFAGTFLGILCILTGAGFYMLDYALKPDNHSGRDIEASYRYMFREYPTLKTWVDSLQQTQALKDTFIFAPDNARLHALYVPAARPTSRTAVIVHGYTDNAIRMLMIGQMYSQKMGFNILLPDLRNSGLSDGDHFQMGWLDRLDVIRWMDVAHHLYGDSTQMVVHGISMGAATTMMVSGEPQPSYVKCFVEDCGYTTAWDEFAHELKGGFSLPAFPLINVTSQLCEWKYGWSFSEASAVEQVKKCPLPMLFIHGDADTYVPTSMVYPLFEAKKGEKELWVVPGAIHAMAYRDNTDEYVQKVSSFVDKYIR